MASAGEPPVIVAVATRLLSQVTLVGVAVPPLALKFLEAEVTVKVLPDGTVTTIVPALTTSVVAAEPVLMVKLMAGEDKLTVVSVE